MPASAREPSQPCCKLRKRDSGDPPGRPREATARAIRTTASITSSTVVLATDCSSTSDCPAHPEYCTPGPRRSSQGNRTGKRPAGWIEAGGRRARPHAAPGDPAPDTGRGTGAAGGARGRSGGIGGWPRPIRRVLRLRDGSGPAGEAQSRRGSAAGARSRPKRSGVAGAARPKCRHATPVATRPRGVRMR